ncbi:hypothetical protein ABIA39_008288 [Nocardia sp. GAS34]|jgi:hypothetical protein
MAVPRKEPDGHCRVRVFVADLLFEFHATMTQARNFAEALRN